MRIRPPKKMSKKEDFIQKNYCGWIMFLTQGTSATPSSQFSQHQRKICCKIHSDECGGRWGWGPPPGSDPQPGGEGAGGSDVGTNGWALGFSLDLPAGSAIAVAAVCPGSGGNAGGGKDRRGGGTLVHPRGRTTRGFETSGTHTNTQTINVFSLPPP